MNDTSNARTCINVSLRVSRAVVHFVVVLAVAACGGGGGGDGDLADSKLFVADSGSFNAIGSVANTNPQPGPIIVDRLILDLSTPAADLEYDASRNYLYVVTQFEMVGVFHNASRATGSLPFTRLVTASVGGSNPTALSLDLTRDMLYLADRISGVRVFHNASTASESAVPGSPINPPDRTLSGDFGPNYIVYGAAVDAARDILYVAVVNSTFPASMSVKVFDNASTVNGSVVPDRVITLTTTAYGALTLFVDSANDRLYVAKRLDQTVEQYENASVATGTPAPSRTVLLPSQIDRVRVLAGADRMYALAQGALYIIPNVSTATGSVSGTAVLAPAGTTFTAIAVTP